ncbi:MAG: DUF4178 domain-containing protein, partial [Acidobacteriota bacterium]
MKASCPNCGAPIEFRFDDSFVRVCDHCRAAVLRTDRELSSLGEVADLTPIETPLRLFSEGHYGQGTFLLVGMAQIRHAAGGIWQEWYAKLGGGTWGWLAEAQGRYYLTFEHAGDVPLPAYESLQPGAVVPLPVPGRATPTPFTVAEVTAASYLAARGELPFRLVPQGQFRYVDLSDGHGLFATIDYGDGREAPSVYVGQQVTLDQLRLSGGEVAPASEPQIRAKRLACPSCNAPVDVRLPGESLRVVCGHCNTILGVETDVAQVIAAQKSRATPDLPLGSKGTLAEGELTVIGFVVRSAFADGDWWPFHEYLLHSGKLGFRWLVESDGNWSYVQPVEAGAVTTDASSATYDGVKFKSFQRTQLRVDQVVGEFYWRVAAGETVEGDDFIAPPAMLSREATGSEENWSLGTFMSRGEVQHAFGNADLPLPQPATVAPNQVDASAGAANMLTLAFFALLVIGLFFGARANGTLVTTQPIVIHPGAPPPPPPPAADPTVPAPADATPTPNVVFSEPFQLAGGKNIELTFHASLTNNWAYIAADLVSLGTGDVVNTDGELESYSGIEDGEHWSEGSQTSQTVVGPVPEGSYMLRLEGQQGDPKHDVSATVTVKQDVFRGKYLGWACVLLGIPWFGFALHAWMFERKRWDQSSYGKAGMPKNATWFAVAMIVALGLVVVGIFKLLGR